MAVNEDRLEELNIWWQTASIDEKMGRDLWKLFTKLRSTTCMTCHHAFEHHGVGDDKTVCWVSGCDCDHVTWTWT